MLLKLPELNGGKDTINKARAVFSKADADVKNALADLEAIAEKLAARFPSLPISLTSLNCVAIIIIPVWFLRLLYRQLEENCQRRSI